VPSLYDAIGAGVGTTPCADPGIADTLARHLALPQFGQGLDLACDTGNYGAAMASRGGRWSGLDLSATMLAQARRAAVGVDWLRGEAAALPFADRRFDAVRCTLTWRQAHGPAPRRAGRRRATMRSSSPTSRAVQWRAKLHFGNMNCTCSRNCQLAPSSGCTTL
jgi:SAM-dependent methyltransferase